MRVAIISTYPPLECGVGVYSYKLRRALNDLIDTKVIGPVGSSADYVVENFQFRKYEGYANSVVNAVIDADPDVVHIQHEYGIWGYGEEFFRLLSLLKKQGFKVVITMHSVDHATKGNVVIEYNNKIGNYADMIIVHSVLQEFELATQGVDQSKIKVIPHGTDPLEEIDSVDAKKAIGLDPSVKTFGYVGFVRGDKRLHDLIFALDILRKKIDNIKLLLVGKPQREKHMKYYKEVLLPLIKERKDVIHINKFLNEEEFKLYMGALDVVVFSYMKLHERKRYAISGAFHHALSLSKVIVASRTSRLYEYLQIAPDLTFAPGDFKTLAENVFKLLIDNVLYQKIKEKIKDYAIKTSWPNVAAMHVEQYKLL